MPKKKTSTPTPLQIADNLEALHGKTAGRSWKVWASHSEVYSDVIENKPHLMKCKPTGGQVCLCEWDGNDSTTEDQAFRQARRHAKFIAACKNDLPVILQEMRRLEEKAALLDWYEQYMKGEFFDAITVWPSGAITGRDINASRSYPTLEEAIRAFREEVNAGKS